MARASATSDYSALIGETVFMQGEDVIDMALFDHAALGIELRLSFNGKFFFEQRFEEPAAVAKAAHDRRREYETLGWTVECQVSLAPGQLAVDKSLAHAVAVG
jgi:hypothetical protein